MSTAIHDLDESELKAMADRYSTLDLHVLKHCPTCQTRICVEDELCPDCQREQERELRAKAFYLTQDEIAKERSQYERR